MKAIAAGAFLILTFFFDPTHNAAYLALFILILADFVFGIAASRKSGEPVRSAKMRRTAIKLTVYFSLIGLANITEYTLPTYMHFLDESVLGFLAATELLSILENAGRLGFVVPKSLKKALGDYTKKS